MTGTERKRAWRERQKKATLAGPSKSTFVIDGPQGQSDVLKALRTEVRLKHSLAADKEIAHLIPAARKICGSLLTRAIRPRLEDVRKYLSGKPLPKI